MTKYGGQFALASPHQILGDSSFDPMIYVMKIHLFWVEKVKGQVLERNLDSI